MSTSNTSDLQAFYGFLGQHLQGGHLEGGEIQGGENLSTPEQLLKAWRAREEFQETVADVRESVADYAAGKGVPAEVAFANVRKKLGGHE